MTLLAGSCGFPTFRTAARATYVTALGGFHALPKADTYENESSYDYQSYNYLLPHDLLQSLAQVSPKPNRVPTDFVISATQ
jgi:hypothetical protein